ncbi:MAG TPA: hypothetical protein DEB05_14675 [Firmicutes bacterium]|jgi:sigma-E factor negative regulatory protein RseC|nr:hypothetical protein [Bacillota bacterium]HBT18187.1 hypothetical protein [Bacillota bacterium]
MEKEAVVIGLEGDQARLRYLRHSACNNCGACSIMGQGEQEVVIPNQLDLQVGDRVEIGLGSSSFLRASLLLYAAPLLLFLCGYLVGEKLMALLQLPRWQEAGGMACGLLFIFFSYKGINLYDQRVKDSEQYQLKVTRIIKKAV